MPDDRPPHCDTLALAAGQLPREALEEMAEVQYAGRLADLGGNVGRRAPAQLHAEAHVVADVEMRIERVALEHHRDVTLARLEVVDAPAADQDVAGRDRFQSGDHPQQRRLATAGRTDQHDEFAVGDVEVDALHAQRIVAECRLADLELQAFGSGHSGLLKVGAGLMFGATMVPAAIAQLYEHYPGIAFQLVSGVTEVNFPLLRAGELDLMFGLLPPPTTIPEYLAYRPIIELSSRVVAGADHPLVRGRKIVRAADLADYPWVVIQHDRELVNNILAALTTEGGRTPRINVEVTSLSSLVRILRAGTYLSSFADAIAAMPDLGLALVPYEQRIIRGEAGVVYHRSLERYGPALRLIELVQSAAAQMRL